MEEGLVGTEPLSEMLPTPIRQKLSPPVAMERDSAASSRHSNVRVPRTARLRGSESLLYSSPRSAVLGSYISKAQTRKVWLTSVNSLCRVLPPYSQAIPFLCCVIAMPTCVACGSFPNVFTSTTYIFPGSS